MNARLTTLLMCFGALVVVAGLASSKAQAQCGGENYYQPAPVVQYAPQAYYSEPAYYGDPTYYGATTYYGAPTYYAPQRPIVYYDTPRSYRTYSVNVGVGHGYQSSGRHGYYGGGYRDSGFGHGSTHHARLRPH